MYLVKALRDITAAISPGVTIRWLANQVGLVQDSVITTYRNNPDDFTVLAGPDFAEVTAQATIQAVQAGASGMTYIMTGATAPVDYAAAVAATKAYASVGADNDLTATAVTAGVAGNALSVSCVQGAGVSVALSVVYAAGAVLITLPTDAASVAVAKTANQVKTAWDAAAAVVAVMTVAVEGSGAGTVAAFASAVLANGADVVAGTGSATAAKGQPYIAEDTGKMYLNGGTAAEPAWKIVTSAA